MNITVSMNVRGGLLANYIFYVKSIFILCLGCFYSSSVWADGLSKTIQAIKPSIVGIGTFQKTRSPALNFVGTGFVVGDGSLVVTNDHVIPKIIDVDGKESLVVIVSTGSKEPELRAAVRIALDKEHDLTLLKFSGTALPAMEVGDSSTVHEGQMFAFTGFPIGMILGFYPVTHRGMLSSITPIVLPAPNSKQLDVKKLAQLQKSAYTVFQLDGTAYPGSSGSPVYDSETGVVYGVINMVFVKGMKESALSHPSGITYAIPGNYVRDLLQRK
ncbi:MAG: serine protease [Sulfurimicrobium sp.]|jgi:S1-C subfamily serine protease|nr:serine protease [Sulfurimicrobium sp.]MDO9191214.1 serine protease [Sulfurimicrobium sp.]MDP2197444.1 serine protease [Sulfurimicrobium sp.]MDP2963861.1 serine protease [Sulfurimicrobium sp.]MDP3686658.1 serine protease [Sulfurimicrobium sp.]